MKSINFNTTADVHGAKELTQLAEAYEQARASAAGFESRILALQVGAAGLMATLAGLAKSVGLVFTVPKNSAVKSIKSVSKAAKEAKRQLASFDEINRLGAPESHEPASAVTTSAPAVGGGLDVSKYMDTVHRLTVYMSGAALALGAILAFSGANVPLGLGLMAVGAAGLAAVAAENWDSMSPGVRTALTRVTGILGGAALAIGAILAFSGVNVPAGLALMALGGAGLATAAALNWDWIPDKLKGIWQTVTDWWGSRVAPKLTAQFWQDKFSGMAEGLKAKVKEGINAAISLMNRFISWLNRSLSFSWNGLNIGGKSILPAGSMQLVNIPPIPMLAQGAVIPPNAPFVAMLGDQRSGNNIEAPEDLIRRIVREEAGNLSLSQDFSFDVNLDGLTLARKLYHYNRQVSAEHGASLIGGI